MNFTINLEYTPRSPQPGLPFTESSFKRQSIPFDFDVSEIGIALVDVWNFGWEDGPVGEMLGAELSLERGLSHARRKRQITQEVIAPTVDELRALGVQIFHCNHDRFLKKYPQWEASTTQQERDAIEARANSSKSCPEPPQNSTPEKEERWPPADWVNSWREQHRELVWQLTTWGAQQSREVYPKIDIAEPVRPQPGDLLVYSGEQFHRLLTERRIRALFYMGFETDECIQFSPYGLANMQDEYQGHGYLCTIVRDGTTTYETAETLDGLWKSKVTIDTIEARWGYSITADALLKAVRSAASNDARASA